MIFKKKCGSYFPSFHHKKDPSNPKYQSLNDTKLAAKCDPDQYVYLSQFLKQIGFQRQTTSTKHTLESTAESQCRWTFNPKLNALELLQRYLTMTLTQMNAVQQQYAAHSQMATVYPPKLGDLVTNKVSFWAKAQKSIDNFWSGSSWGNYHCVLIIVNMTADTLSVHWINRCGIEREEGTVVEPRKSVTIFAQLNHPHVIKRRGHALYGIGDEYVVGYNPTARGTTNNGCHVVFVGGKLKGHQVQQKALELIQKAPPDKRVKPTITAAPSPPHPEDRRGKFYGGR